MGNSKTWRNLLKPQYGWTTKASKDGSVKLLRTTDISHGKIDWDSVPYCENIPADVTKYLVQANDILVSRAGSVGVSFLINDVPSKMEQKITQSNLLLLENEIVNFIGFYYTYCYYIDRQVVKYMVTYQVEQNGIK